jgi:hypothetical protein
LSKLLDFRVEGHNFLVEFSEFTDFGKLLFLERFEFLFGVGYFLVENLSIRLSPVPGFLL